MLSAGSNTPVGATGSVAPVAETLVAEHDPQDLEQLPNREEQSRLAWAEVDAYCSALDALLDAQYGLRPTRTPSSEALTFLSH